MGSQSSAGATRCQPGRWTGQKFPAPVSCITVLTATGAIHRSIQSPVNPPVSFANSDTSDPLTVFGRPDEMASSNFCG